LAIDYRIRYYFRITHRLALGAYKGWQHLRGRPPWDDRVRVPIAPHLTVDQASTTMPKLADDFFTSLQSTVEEIQPVRRTVDPRAGRKAASSST
jgi:hypothetical protein